MDDETKPFQGENESNASDVENSSSIALVKELNSFKELIKDHLDKQTEQNIFKDNTIDRLQKLVYEYEKGFIQKIKEPILMNLIIFRDSFQKFKEKFEYSIDYLFKEIEMLDEELEDILYSHGITELQIDNEFYDREIHIARRKIPTDKIENDKKISRILKKGYILDEKLLRKAEIEVFVYEKQHES